MSRSASARSLDTVSGNRTIHGALALLLVTLTLTVLQPAPVEAFQAGEIPPLPDGCLDYDSGAVGMYEDVVDPAGGFTLDIDGPVVLVIIEWSGIWRTDPTDPTIGVEVTGPGGTLSESFPGTQSAKDPTRLGANLYFAHGYFAEITDLFGDGEPGAYTVEVTPPVDGQGPPENHLPGATVTAVFDTSPCGEISQVIWKTGADFYFGGAAETSPTTELIVYAWDEPLVEDFVATFQTSQGLAPQHGQLPGIRHRGRHRERDGSRSRRRPRPRRRQPQSGLPQRIRGHRQPVHPAQPAL